MPAQPARALAHTGDLAALVTPGPSGVVVELALVCRVIAGGLVASLRVQRRRAAPADLVTVAVLPPGSRILLVDRRRVPVRAVLDLYAARMPDVEAPEQVPPLPTVAGARLLVRAVLDERRRVTLEAELASLPHMGRM